MRIPLHRIDVAADDFRCFLERHAIQQQIRILISHPERSYASEHHVHPPGQARTTVAPKKQHTVADMEGPELKTPVELKWKSNFSHCIISWQLGYHLGRHAIQRQAPLRSAPLRKRLPNPRPQLIAHEV